MQALTINLNDDLARQVTDLAMREHKSVSEWVEERIKLNLHRTAVLASTETNAVGNGYPAGWSGLFGCLADDDAFVAPFLSATRESGAHNGR